MTRPPPPEEYGSWLDYAVATMDSRAAALNYLFAKEGQWSRDDVKRAVRDELAELRRLAERGASAT